MTDTATLHDPSAPLAEDALRVPAEHLTAAATLPADADKATLIGRVMTKDGPSVVIVDKGRVIDITNSWSTTSDLFEQENPVEAARAAIAKGKDIGSVDEILANSAARDKNKPYLLSPADYQEIEAAGVTFVKSLVERMVENRAMTEVPPGADGKMDDAKLAEVRTRVRAEVEAIVGTDDFSKIKPGSPEALKILENMKEKGMNLIYPQVGLGEMGELFSKASTGLSVGHGAQAGYSSDGKWTNPEPEVVLFGNSKGKIVGAAQGNDVNDRWTEGQSALYLHEAKVRNGSTVIGPFVRLFDDNFSLEDVKKTEVALEVKGADGALRFKGANNMATISRSPERIMAQAMGPSHFRPHGVAVFLGTMTVPENDLAGQTFTHKEGDIVTIGSPQLGHLTNVMLPAEKVMGLETGPLALARNLASRGLLTARETVRGINPRANYIAEVGVGRDDAPGIGAP